MPPYFLALIAIVCLRTGTAQGAPSPNPSSDQALIQRVAEISSIHSRLFRGIGSEVYLPVHIGYRQPPYLTTADLFAGLTEGRWSADTSRAIERFLEDVYLDRKSSFFLLDPEARAFVKKRPSEIRRLSERTGQSVSDSDIVLYGRQGAIEYFKRRQRVASLPVDQLREAWQTAKDIIYYRNETHSPTDLKLISDLTGKMISNFSALTRDELSDIERLDIAWDKASVIKRHNRDATGANQFLTAELANAPVETIIASLLRMPPSPETSRALLRELERIVASLVEVLEPPAQARLLGLKLVEGNPQAEADSEIFDAKLWFKARRRDAIPTITGAGTAVFAGFATCSARSYVLRAWNIEGLLRQGNVKSASNLPRRSPMVFLWPKSVRDRTNDETNMLISQVVAEDDVARNQITPVEIVDDIDNPIPLIETVYDARRISASAVSAFSQCLDSYFGFVLAHELAHLYLSDDPTTLELNELKVDCAALKHLQNWYKRDASRSKLAPSAGFMGHLLQMSGAVNRAVTNEVARSAQVNRRYDALLDQRCLVSSPGLIGLEVER